MAGKVRSRIHTQPDLKDQNHQPKHTLTSSQPSYCPILSTRSLTSATARIFSLTYIHHASDGETCMRHHLKWMYSKKGMTHFWLGVAGDESLLHSMCWTHTSFYGLFIYLFLCFNPCFWDWIEMDGMGPLIWMLWLLCLFLIQSSLCLWLKVHRKTFSLKYVCFFVIKLIVMVPQLLPIHKS